MSAEIPTNNQEKKEILDDNARKFIINALDQNFLEKNGASSFLLITDWLETGEDNEKKVAYKKFENGDIQILLIEKITKDGNRTAEKKPITEAVYREYLEASKLHLEKRRYEFTYVQNGTSFAVKYDEFIESELRILEVDASSEEERNSFNPEDYPSKLTEVTGDLKYYGYRVATVT